MRCDMCGVEGNLSVVLVEGAKLNLCNNCKRFGRVIEDGNKKNTEHKKTKKLEINTKHNSHKNNKTNSENIEYEEKLVSNLGQLLRNKRIEIGETPEKFSNKLGIKESLYLKIESGHFKPSFITARKIQKLINIKVIEKVKVIKEDEEETKQYLRKPTESKKLTLGDFIKIKTKKKK